MFNQPDASYHGLVYTDHFGAAAYIARCRSVYQRTTGAVLSPLSRLPAAAGHRDASTLRVERHVENARKVAEFLRDDPRVAWVNYAGFADSPYLALAQKYLGGRVPSLLTFGVKGGLDAGKALLRRAEAGQAAGQYRRRQIARLPSRLDHASADVAGGAGQGRRPAGDDPARASASSISTTSSRTSIRPWRRRRMPRHAARRKASSEMNAIPARQSFDGPPLQIALVNNMPDQAIDATKAQFVNLLRAGAGKVPFRLRCYALSSVPRGETARRAIARSHEDIEALYARGADALIVTGSEPRAERLENEPYWDDFARLVDWARVHTISALWSCLAAHGAVLRLDGVTRRRAREKISGVFACDVDANDWATRGAANSILVPHSRYNGLSRSDLVERGYRISSWSGDVEVDCFWRREPSLFLFTQGHPEYNADALAREFRRDALRFLNGESDCFPISAAKLFFERGPSRARRIETIRGLARAPASRANARPNRRERRAVAGLG